ncbi:MAG: hypothetical protein ACYST6_14390 [Planctomycetota bacterium]|jgi:hypothetical protein
MKRISLFGQVAVILLLCFGLIMVAAVMYRKKLQAKRLDCLLRFEDHQIQKCTVGPAILCDKMTTLNGEDANSLARRFAARLKEHCRHIKKDESSDLAPTHRISFTAKQLTWEFRFKFDQSPPCRLIQCRTPDLNGTIILDREAVPQFEDLIKKVMDEQSKSSNERNETQSDRPRQSSQMHPPSAHNYRT